MRFLFSRLRVQRLGFHAMLHPQLRLRTMLVVPFVLQVVATIGLVGYLSYRNGQKAIQDLSGQLRMEVMARVEEQVDRYLELPVMVNEVNVRMARQNLLDLNNPALMEQYFLEQSKLFHNLGTIAFSNTKYQNFVGSNGNEKYVSIATNETGMVMRRYAYGDQPGKRGKLITEKVGYDVRTRAWYKAALSSRQPIWSEIDPAPLGQRLDLSAVHPIYDLGDRLQGVFVTQVSLSGITQFLKSLDVSKSGQVFIVERNGLLVASSASEYHFIPGQNGQLPARLPALQSPNTTLQGTVKTLIDRFGGLEHIHQMQQLDFYVQQEHQFLQVKPFQDQRGIDWLIVVVVPESAFMGEINANTRTTGFLCLGALSLTIAFGVWVAYRITRPLSRITQASKEIANGQLQHKIYSSSIAEITSLGHSFNSMAKQLRDSFTTLETRVEQRTADLQQEKDRSEQLLLNILPASIAEQLKNYDCVPAEHFEEATILFADIVGFTSLSARLEPMQLVAGLNQIFSAFDYLAEQHGLEKIKTIGDAYMVAGGLPIHRRDHAQAIAEMALGMRAAMLGFTLAVEEPLEIRIGIHTGPVVAGVIGTRKFIYDLWGDAVNVASRMESHSQPGRIQVTHATYQLLKNEYILESRGVIAVKGRGEMETYWLLDRRASSIDIPAEELEVAI